MDFYKTGQDLPSYFFHPIQEIESLKLLLMQNYMLMDTAEECMDSFDMFEKDSSFGPLMTCRPIFFPLNDEELEAFKAAFAAGKTSAEKWTPLTESLCLKRR